MTTTSGSTRPLTAKQEAYANLLFQGLSQRQAYIQAGYSSEQAPEALDVNACELAKDTKVLVRINELKQASRSKAIASVEERKQLLSEIARERHQAPATAGHRIAAMGELSKLGGDYPAEKHQVAHHVTFEVVYKDAPQQLQDARQVALPTPGDQLGMPNLDRPVTEVVEGEIVDTTSPLGQAKEAGNGP